MDTALFLLLFGLGRLASLGIYRMGWSNGLAGDFKVGSPVLTLLARPPWWIIHLLFVVPAVNLSWSDFPVLRVISIVLTFLLATGAILRFGSADLGRWFLADRLLVLTLAFGVIVSPAFLYPCLVAAVCLQYTVASFRLGPGYSNLLGFELVRASLSLLTAAIALFGTVRLTGIPWPGFGSLTLAALLALQASSYVNHALAKSALGPKWWSWIRHNRIECLAANAWLRGWTMGRNRERLMRQVHWFANHRIALCAGAWLLETSWVFVLLDPRLAVALLAATIVFHALLFALTGLSGHHYLVNHACLIGLLLFAEIEGVFRPSHLAGCLLVIPSWACWIAFLRRKILADGLSSRVARFADPADHLMAWWDTPLMRLYTYSVETVSGKTFSVPVPKLSPHDTALTDLHTHLMILGVHEDFDPTLAPARHVARTGVWGLTIFRPDRDFLYQLMDTPDPDLRDLLGRPDPPPCWHEIPSSAESLRRLFAGMNGLMENRWFRLIMRWPHFPGEDLAPDLCPLSVCPPRRFRFDEAIAVVSIHRVTTFLCPDGITLIDDRLLGRLPLPPSDP